MKKLSIILLILLFGCAGLQPVQPVNVSDELKEIVYADETAKSQNGKWTLALGAEIYGGIYISRITVEDEAVRVEYMLMLPNGSILGFFSDEDGDGIVDGYGEMINGIPSLHPKELVQECYENYVNFARDISENGVIKPEEGVQET